MRRRRLGSALIVVAVAAFVVMLLASAVAAPSRSATGGGGPTLVGIQGGGYGLHKYGSVRLYGANGSIQWRYDGANSYFDVTRRQDGTVLAGFMHSGYDSCGPYESPCSRTGFQVIDPTPTPEVTFRHSFPVRSKQNSEVHDVEALPSGNFLYTDMEHERIVIVDRQGHIRWQWNASSRYQAPNDPTRTDWLHINDVDRIGDGRYLVSVRNANQLLVVERGQGVVEVVNRDADPSVLFRQHNPQWLGDGRVLVADSGNDRIVELARDESTGEWRVVWSLHGAGGLAFDWPRDADRLPNNHTLITDTVNKRVVEVTETGDVIWSLGTDYKPYEADRLPAGEPVGGAHYGAGTGGPAPADIPVITRVYHLVRPALPLPYWFGARQLLGTLVSFAGLVAGGWLRWTG